MAATIIFPGRVGLKNPGNNKNMGKLIPSLSAAWFSYVQKYTQNKRRNRIEVKVPTYKKAGVM